MGSTVNCFVCELAFEPDRSLGIGVLKTFEGYTVDRRIGQFRKFNPGQLPEFIDFIDPEAEPILARMHEKAIEISNEMVNNMRDSDSIKK